MRHKLLVCIIVVSALASFGQEESQQQDALLLYRNGQYQSAITVTENEIAANPQNMDAYTVMGWSLLALGRYNLAVTTMQSARRANSFDSRIIHILTEAYFSLGDFEKAIQEGNRYLRLTPNGRYIDQIHYFMGIAYRELGYTLRAEISLSAANFYNDTNASWWEALGAQRELVKDWEGALYAFEQALALNENSQSAQEAIARLQRIDGAEINN